MYDLSFSPDGTLLASAHADSITLWRMPAAAPAGELKFDKRYDMFHVSFSPDGKLLATSNDPTGEMLSAVFLWDPATRRRVGDTLPARVFAFSPDGKTVATDGGHDNSVVLWDLHSRRQSQPPLAGHTARIRCIGFSPDGQMLASGGEDHSAVVWDLSVRRPEAHTLTGHRAPVNAVAFNPQYPILATGSGDGTVILWDLDKWQPMGSTLSAGEKPVFSVAFSPDGQTLASNYENQVVTWDLAEDFPLGRALKIENQPTEQVMYSPDGQTLASVDTYGQVTLSNAETGEVLHDSIGEKVTHVAFSPDGSQCATVNWHGEIAFWDTATGELRGTAEKTDSRLFSASFSPDGKTLAAGGDAVLLLWDVPGRRWQARIIGQQRDRIWSVAFSPDGRLLASGGNTSLGLWDAKTGSPVMAPVATDAGEDYLLPTDVAFSRDGKMLAYRAGAQAIVLWDVAQRRQMGAALTGRGGTFTAFAFSPDAKVLATGASNGAVVLWDVATRQPLGRPLDSRGEDIKSLAFRADGRALAALAEKRLVIWDLDEASWRARACRLARNLTNQEWNRFFGPAVAYHETCPDEHFAAAK
jgi:WD40 repeat protein